MGFVGGGGSGQIPPGRFGRKSEEQGISSGQAVAVLQGVYGLETDERELARMLRETHQEKHWTHWFLTPEMVSLAAGWIRQRRALWWRRGYVRGDVVCEVSGIVPEKSVRMMLPYERAFDPIEKQETIRLFERMACQEWPTGRLTGWMVLEPDQEQYEATPRYAYVRVEESG